jgi:hypothetical protein
MLSRVCLTVGDNTQGEAPAHEGARALLVMQKSRRSQTATKSDAYATLFSFSGRVDQDRFRGFLESAVPIQLFNRIQNYWAIFN